MRYLSSAYCIHGISWYMVSWYHGISSTSKASSFVLFEIKKRTYIIMNLFPSSAYYDVPFMPDHLHYFSLLLKHL